MKKMVGYVQVPIKKLLININNVEYKMAFKN